MSNSCSLLHYTILTSSTIWLHIIGGYYEAATIVNSKHTFPTWLNVPALYNSNAKLVDIVRSTLSLSIIHWPQSCRWHVTLNVTKCLASLLIQHNHKNVWHHICSQLNRYNSKGIMNVLIPQTDVTPVILSWDFVVPLYHATKSRYATVDVATTDKHGFCNTFLLYDTPS